MNDSFRMSPFESGHKKKHLPRWQCQPYSSVKVAKLMATINGQQNWMKRHSIATAFPSKVDLTDNLFAEYIRLNTSFMIRQVINLSYSLLAIYQPW